MSHNELMAKKELCLWAADGCKSIKMWAMWVRKANDLRYEAMRSLEVKKIEMPIIIIDETLTDLDRFYIACENLKKSIIAEFFGKYRINKYGFVRYNKFYLLMEAIAKWMK